MSKSNSSRSRRSVLVLGGFIANLVAATLFAHKANSQPGEVIEVLSRDFRFTDIVAAEITYDLTAIIPSIEFGGPFTLDVVPVRKGVSNSTPGIVTLIFCYGSLCPQGPMTSDVVNVKPEGHVDGQTVYRVRARQQQTDLMGVPIWVSGPIPGGTVTHAALHLNGDYNYDGEVNAADYVVWRDTRGSTLIPADGDGSGTVDDADYATWRSKYGGTLAATSALTIPEPSTLFCVILLGLGGIVRPRNLRKAFTQSRLPAQQLNEMALFQPV